MIIKTSNSNTKNGHFIFSWLTSELSMDDKPEPTSKPKWFEEMLKNADSEEKKAETMKSKEKDEDVFDLECKLSAKENQTTNSNQIYSRRRNTLNILKTENQNFLNTLSKSAKPFMESDIFSAQSLSQPNKTNDSSSKEIFNLIDRPSESVKLEDSFNTSFNDSSNESNRKSDSRMAHSELPEEMFDLKRSKQSSSALSQVLPAVQMDRLVASVLENNSDSIEAKEDFIIPHLPEGRVLRILLKSNYGDDNWIGLNGLEVFDSRTFERLTSANVRILKNPPIIS